MYVTNYWNQIIQAKVNSTYNNNSNRERNRDHIGVTRLAEMKNLK